MVRILAWIIALLTVTAMPAIAQTAKWPLRPVRVIVPFPPGGSTDIIARLISPHLTPEFGQLAAPSAPRSLRARRPTAIRSQ